ncbi:unnamed protein product [Gadus morhua 'NCC']
MIPQSVSVCASPPPLDTHRALGLSRLPTSDRFLSRAKWVQLSWAKTWGRAHALVFAQQPGEQQGSEGGAQKAPGPSH